MAKKKIDFKKVAMNALVSGGTGVVANIFTKSVLTENEDTQDMILAGAGLILPELVKRPEIETASTGLISIAAFRMSDRNDLAGKLGIHGFDDSKAIGKNSGWTPTKTKLSGGKKVEDSAVK